MIKPNSGQIALKKRSSGKVNWSNYRTSAEDKR